MKTAFLLVIMLMLIISVDAQNTVFVSASEFGRGILKERDGEFFVITPAHVVNEETDKVKIVGESIRTSTATFAQSYEPDIALLRIDGGGKQICNDWKVSKDFDNILRKNSTGTIEYREETGASKFIEVNLVEIDNEYITVANKTSGTPISKGLSGSSLFMQGNNEKVYMGMLLNVESGKANFLRADYMMSILNKFFEKSVDVSRKSQANTNTLVKPVTSKQIKMGITKIDHDKTKVTVHFTLENTNPSLNVVKYNTRLNFHKLTDQSGNYFEAKSIQYSNATEKVELIYNTPIKCKAEFEVGTNTINKIAKLELNSYSNEFIFYNIPMGNAEAFIEEESVDPGIQKLTAKEIDKQVSLTLTGFQQNQSKAIFYFKLENLNPSTRIIKMRTSTGLNKLIDQNGLSYKASSVEYGNGGTDVELIYKTAVACTVEFEVGANIITEAANLQLNANGYEFSFGSIQLSEGIANDNHQTFSTSSEEDVSHIVLGQMDTKGIKMVVNQIKQTSNKVTVKYTLENIDPTKHLIDARPNINLASLQAGDYTFKCKSMVFGNSETLTSLVYRRPINCYAEFEVNAITIDNINLLKLSLYNYNFEFVGKGPLNAPGSLKSMQSIEQEKKLIKAGGDLLEGWFKDATKKK